MLCDIRTNNSNSCTNDGGTAEFVGASDVFLHFQTVSNELSSPKILVCPNDPAKTKAMDFDTFSNQNLSYFVGLTSNENDFQSILSGDRNLTTNGTALSAGVFTLSTNNKLGWTTAIHNNAGNGFTRVTDGSGLPAHVN